jgi:hypothetical protein
MARGGDRVRTRCRRCRAWTRLQLAPKIVQRRPGLRSLTNRQTHVTADDDRYGRREHRAVGVSSEREETSGRRRDLVGLRRPICRRQLQPPSNRRGGFRNGHRARARRMRTADYGWLAAGPPIAFLIASTVISARLLTIAFPTSIAFAAGASSMELVLVSPFAVRCVIRT